MAKTCNFQTSKTPPFGGRFPPFKNCFSQGPTENNAHNSDRGSDPPKGVKIESRPKNHEKNGRQEGRNGETGSRNMSATPKMNFLTLVSYSLPDTFGGLSRTVTELYWWNLSITPLKTRKKLSPISLLSNFDRHFLGCPAGEFLQICTVPRGHRVLSN